MSQVLVAVILGLSLMVSGCAGRCKASPSQGAGFVPMAQMAPRADLPFQKVWFKEGVDFKRYKSIYIPGGEHQFPPAVQLVAAELPPGPDAGRFGHHGAIHAAGIQNRLRNDPYRRFQVVEAPQKDSLTLELALTELVPSNVALSVLEYAPYGGGTAVRVMGKSHGRREHGGLRGQDEGFGHRRHSGHVRRPAGEKNQDH